MSSRFVLLLLALALPGCGLFGEKEEEERPQASRIVVGEVTSVHSDQGFVLFRRYGPGDLLSGGLLSARSLDGRRAVSLELSPETLGRFYTADYSKKEDPPRVGDVVVLSKGPDDTQNDIFSGNEASEEELEVKKISSSLEPEILDSTASQGSR